MQMNATAAQPEYTLETQGQQPGTKSVECMMQIAAEKARIQAEKKTEAVFRSMLVQQGMDNTAASRVTAEWMARQQTLEKMLNQRDETILMLRRQIAEKEREAAAVEARRLLTTRLKREGLHEEALGLFLELFPDDRLQFEDGTLTNEEELVHLMRSTCPHLFLQEGNKATEGKEARFSPVM